MCDNLLNFYKIKDYTWRLDATKFAQPPEITVFLLSFTRINKKFPDAKINFIYSEDHKFIDYVDVEFNDIADDAFFQVYFSEFIS